VRSVQVWLKQERAKNSVFFLMSAVLKLISLIKKFWGLMSMVATGSFTASVLVKTETSKKFTAFLK
jgi:hypothetical protein